MLRVAELLKCHPTVIEDVANELQSIRMTTGSRSIAEQNVLRIEGRGRVYLFLLSEDFRDDLLLRGDSEEANWTGKFLSLQLSLSLQLICVPLILNL